jgi:serine/threonine-protein kinase
MPLTPGTRIRSYEVVGAIGAGGMGEVYRARDTRLNRDVAIKVLPERFVADTDRLTRFEREAQVLASFNHPAIGAIYGIEEFGDMRCLILELVEGPTLEEHLKAHGSGLPLDEALIIARQIAEALEAAHDKGIVHRDLKPANIKVRSDGTVKVLDFGLAKYGGAMPAVAAANLTNSPTLTFGDTEVGMILGTAAYMSPEQARGQLVDQRADVWSFGCVLFEMLSGRQPFEIGSTVSDAIAAILRSEPAWAALPAGTPPQVRRMLMRALVKDPRGRLRHIGDAAIEITDAIANPGAGDTAPAPSAGPAPRSRLVIVPWLLAGGFAAAVAAMVAINPPWRRTQPAQALRFSAQLGTDATYASDLPSSIAISADGQTVVFEGRRALGQRPVLYVRRMNQLQATELRNTESSFAPFLSPDARWIGFFQDNKLRKVSIDGGAPITICDARNGRGGTWLDAETIVFTPDLTGKGLYRVSAAGGKPEPLFPLASDEATERWPQVLPGGKTVLYTGSSATGTIGNANANLYARMISGGERRLVQPGSVFARYVPTGHLLFVRSSTLFAVRFDPERLAVSGTAVPLVDGITQDLGSIASQFAVSDTGTLVYSAGRVAGVGASVPISWLGRDGRLATLRKTGADWTDIRFSPDGRQVAMDISDGKQRDVWIYDWTRDTMSRLTFDASDDASPVWTPDGKRIAFASKRGDGQYYNIYWTRADGAGEAQRLTVSPHHQIPESFDPTGRTLAFHDISPETGGDIMTVTIDGSEAAGWKARQPVMFLKTPAYEENPVFSPDGRWIAYDSNETGTDEVYVRPFPGPGGKWQVSTEGGVYPTWSTAQHELIWAGADLRLMVAPYRITGDSFAADKPRSWADVMFAPGQYRRYDIHPDGTRAAISKDPGAPIETRTDSLIFVLNFFDELRRLTAASPSN